MNRSDSIGALAGALAKAQKAIEGAAKDSKNPHFNSKYADLASIVTACREPLATNELAVVQSSSVPDAGIVSMTTMLIHSSGEWIESDPLRVQAKDAGPQAVGSCLTYLRRYQLASMVGIAPEDDDAEAGEGRIVPRAPVQAPRPQAIPGRPMTPNTHPKPGRGELTQQPPDAPPLTDRDIPFDVARGGKR